MGGCHVLKLTCTLAGCIRNMRDAAARHSQLNIELLIYTHPELLKQSLALHCDTDNWEYIICGSNSLLMTVYLDMYIIFDLNEIIHSEVLKKMLFWSKGLIVHAFTNYEKNLPLWDTMFGGTVFTVWPPHSLTVFRLCLLRPLLGVAFFQHGVCHCSFTPDSRCKICGLLSRNWETLLKSLVLLALKRQLIGWKEMGPIGLRGRDAAALSFICLAGRLPINEVVKGGNICGGGDGKGFSGRLWFWLFWLGSLLFTYWIQVVTNT